MSEKEIAGRKIGVRAETTGDSGVGGKGCLGEVSTVVAVATVVTVATVSMMVIVAAVGMIGALSSAEETEEAETAVEASEAVDSIDEFEAILLTRAALPTSSASVSCSVGPVERTKKLVSLRRRIGSSVYRVDELRDGTAGPSSIIIGKGETEAAGLCREDEVTALPNLGIGRT